MNKTWMLFLGAVAGLAVSAEVNRVGFQNQTLDLVVLTNEYSVAVEAGDVVVMTAASSKKITKPIGFSSTAGAFATVDTGAANPYPVAYSAWQTVASTGTDPHPDCCEATSSISSAMSAGTEAKTQPASDACSHKVVVKR
jgi:hypothetical protein